MIKVFLVEDEKIIRKSIKNNVKWEENGFEFAGEAPDGEIPFALGEENTTEEAVQKYRDVLKSTVIMQDTTASYILL